MINIAVEGESDREAARAVIRATGLEVNQVRVAGGKSKLDPLIPKYNQAAAQTPWVVFRDSDAECPVELRSRLLANVRQHEKFRLRIAHSMTEAWLLGDTSGFASYFSISLSRVPREPESLGHAKSALLALCANSRSRAVRDDMVATDGKAGPLYVLQLNTFAAEVWDVASASGACPSLHRAIHSIRELAT